MKLEWLKMVMKEKGNTVGDSGRRNRRLELFSCESDISSCNCTETASVLETNISSRINCDVN